MASTSTTPCTTVLLIFVRFSCLLELLLIDFEQLLLTRVVHEPFAALTENMSLEQVELMAELVDQLLLRFDRFGLLIRSALQLFEQFLLTIQHGLLRCD